MKKLLALAGTATMGFAHLHTQEGSDLLHILSEPDHILIMAALGVAVFGFKKLVNVKIKGKN